MKMISTPTAVAATSYPAYVENCLRNPACEPAYFAPVPGVPYLQFFVNFGAYKPATAEFTLVDLCTADQYQIFSSNYVIGLDPDGNWYGVFKYFTTPPAAALTTFVVHLSAMVDAPAGFVEKTFFSQSIQIEPCLPLMKIKSCYPEGAVETGFDINGIYYGLPTTAEFLGIEAVRYFHIAWVRLGKVRELSNKATFKSSLLRTFRSTIEKIHQVETELVPKWYKDQLLAIYARGAVSINDGPAYIVSDLNFEAINEDDLRWKPYAQLKETFRLYFGCDASECLECCSPIVLQAYTNAPSGSSASVSESVSGSVPGFDPDAQAFIDAVEVLDEPQQIAINDLVLDLKGAALWSKLKAIYPIVGGTAAAHKWNLKDPQDTDAAYRLSIVGGWTHSSTGMLPNGSTGYADTHLNPAMDLTAISGTLGYYSRSDNNLTGYDMGNTSVADTNNTMLICRYTNDRAYMNYGAATYQFSGNFDGRGLFVVNRRNNTNTQAYLNGATFYDVAAAVTLESSNIYIGAANKVGTAVYHANKECAFAFIGDGMSDAEQSDLYDIIQDFQIANARQV